MAFRTALAIVLACSPDLASIPPCPAAGHSTSDAAVKSKPSAEPFGRIVSPLADGWLRRKWSALIRKLGDEIVQLALCDGDRAGCASSSAIELLAVVDRARDRDGRARVGEVNRSINLAIRPRSDLAQYGELDVWQSPLTTFATGGGDCEDYAIAKYLALRGSGEPASNLRIVIVHDDIVGEDHALAAIQLDGHWLILDNRRMALVEDGYARGYRPLFVFNETGIWKYDNTAPLRLVQRVGPDIPAR